MMEFFKRINKHKALLIALILLGVYVGFSFAFFINSDSVFDPLFISSVVGIIAFTAIGMLLGYVIILLVESKGLAYQLKVSTETNSMRSLFAAMLLHHIRTPLSGIKWSLKELLKSKDIPKNYMDMLAKILDESERSLQSVDHLVAASQASLDRIAYVFEVVSSQVMLEIVQKQADMIRGAADDKRITVACNLGKSSEHLFNIDKDKINNVIETLLQNAVAYTPQGGTITIAAHEQNNSLLVSVKDTGIGIADQDREKIFSQFFRTKEAQKIRPSGFGIGLYLCQSFINHHQGEISFDSQLGKGTTFTVSLPKFVAPVKDALATI